MHRQVTAGHNGDVGRGAFFRLLPATSTHRYALTANPFPAGAPNLDVVMPRFYFNLVGDTPAHDVLGQDFSGDRKARAHAMDLARHLATDKLLLARDGNAVVIVAEDGREIDPRRSAILPFDDGWPAIRLRRICLTCPLLPYQFARSSGCTTVSRKASGPTLRALCLRRGSVSDHNFRGCMNPEVA
jgi:hypothetical protein